LGTEVAKNLGCKSGREVGEVAGTPGRSNGRRTLRGGRSIAAGAMEGNTTLEGCVKTRESGKPSLKPFEVVLARDKQTCDSRASRDLESGGDYYNRLRKNQKSTREKAEGKKNPIEWEGKKANGNSRVTSQNGLVRMEWEEKADSKWGKGN